MPYLLAAVGGAGGALARWAVATALPPSPGRWPWATLGVNLLGCFLIGALLVAVARSRPGAGWVHPLLGVGLLGGFTTFSAFALESVQLVGAGRVLPAGGYVLASVVGCLLAVVAGARSARAVLGPTP